ncbi:hypothetical protein B0T24DRAFT_606234 [Lasiosphaeria ovina]|uniref:Uncharacterized protein n=1 Tax=Lasiosphaeria ovina TaxID=92902 RepID=A0AAE0NLP5_9PEZI|nr:hypothetical protein B0T24DRAFT_606234 [Lasiosphaeria ovina]
MWNPGVGLHNAMLAMRASHLALLWLGQVVTFWKSVIRVLADADRNLVLAWLQGRKIAACFGFTLLLFFQDALGAQCLRYKGFGCRIQDATACCIHPS